MTPPIVREWGVRFGELRLYREMEMTSAGTRLLSCVVCVCVCVCVYVCMKA